MTDSGSEITFDESRPAITNLLTVYHLLTGKSEEASVEHFSGRGYGDFKNELAEVVIEFLRPFQQRFSEIDDGALRSILQTGAEKARVVAKATVDDVYRKVGII